MQETTIRWTDAGSSLRTVSPLLINKITFAAVQLQTKAFPTSPSAQTVFCRDSGSLPARALLLGAAAAVTVPASPRQQHISFSLLQEVGGMVLTNLSIQTCVGITRLNVQKKQTKSHYPGIEEKKAFWGVTGLKWRCQEHAWTRMTEVSFIEVLRFQTSDHHTGISGSLQYFGERGSCTNWHRSELVSYRTTQSHTQALAALI